MVVKLSHEVMHIV